MKKIIAIIAAVVCVSSIHAQIQDPVKWSFTASKKTDKEYVITLTASLDNAWHIYSINTPANGPVPTNISFSKNPLVSLNGSVKENGKLKSEHDDVFGTDVKYYADKVEFIQTIDLKSAVKIKVNGTIKYMVCNDKMCLPPKTIPFSVSL